MGLRHVVMLSLFGLAYGQGFDPNQVNQQMGGNFDPNAGVFGGWGWNEVTTSNPGGPSYDPNAANANFGTMSAASTPPTASPHPGNLGWGVDPQWGFGTPGSGGTGFGPGVITGSPGAGSGFTLSQVLSGGDMPAVGRK